MNKRKFKIDITSLVKIPKLTCDDKTATEAALKYEEYLKRWLPLTLWFGTINHLPDIKRKPGRPAKYEYDTYIAATQKQIDDTMLRSEAFKKAVLTGTPLLKTVWNSRKITF